MSQNESGYLEYNIELNATITENNVIGPTTNATLRPNASLPRPNSATAGNDANTIYLDPVNGDDANTGFTNILAKETFQGANLAVNAVRDTIHILVLNVNGAAIVLSEEIIAAQVLTQDLEIIQVNENQTCRLTLTGDGGYYQRTVNTQPLQVNGLEVIGAPNSVRPPLGLAGTGIESNYEWCRMEAPLLAVSIGVSSVAKDCIFRVTDPNGLCAQLGISSPGLDPTLLNCALIGDAPGTTGIKYEIVAFFTEASLTNCVLSNFETAILTDGGAALLTVQPSKLIVNNCGTLQTDTSIPGVVLEFANSLINVTNNGAADISSATNVFNEEPLFFDEAGENFRLAHILRSVDGVRFPRTSPAVGIGSDAGAFDVTIGAVSETSQDLDIPADASFDKVGLSYERDNFQKWSDIQGRARQTWDEVTQAIDIKWAGDWWAGTNFSLRYAIMTRYRSFLRFYPEGLQGLFRIAPVLGVNGIAAPSTVGTRVVDISAAIAASSVLRDLEPEAYNGWVAFFGWTLQFGSPESGYFLIETHDGDTITLGTQLRGTATWPGGELGDSDELINIVYMPCLLDQPSVAMQNELYENRVSLSSEPDSESVGPARPWYKRTDNENSSDAPEEWHARSMKLVQTDEESTL